MATTTIPLVTSILAFVAGIFVITSASKRDDPSSIILTLGATGIVLSFLINIVYR